MKKSKIFLGIGCVMVVVAIAFIAFALNHPEMSFPWSNSITYTIYGAYLIITVAMFCLFVKMKNK